jgi:signal transduction histidine kinase/uncharacterized protein HemY
MIKYFLILLFIFCINSPIFSQKIIYNQSKVAFQIDSLNKIAEKLVVSNPDSVLRIINKIKQIPNSANCFSELGTSTIYESYAYFFKSDYQKAHTTVKEAILILNKSTDSYNLGFAYHQLASLEDRFGNVKEALGHFDKAIELMKKVENPARLHLVYNNLGALYQKQGNYSASIKNYTNALELAEKHQNKSAISSYLTNIGNIYFYQSDFDKALEYYFKSVVIQEEIKNFRSLGITYNNIGGVYITQKKYKEALSALQKSKAYHSQFQYKKGKISVFINLGISYINLEQYDSAGLYLQEALEIQQESNDLYDLALIFTNIAKNDLAQKKYDTALEFINKAYQTAKDIQSRSQVAEILDIKREILIAQENYKEAYATQNLYHSIKDSLYSVESKSEINAVLLERKELENQRLEQENNLKIIELEKTTLEKKSKEQAFTLLEKQGEADRLFAEARETQNEKKADSLFQAAQNAQLEADNLKIKAEKDEAEKRATKAESEQKIIVQKNISLLFGVGILAALIIAFIAYRNQRNKQKANLLLAEKNEEINLQNELLAQSNQTKDRLFSIVAHDLRSPIAAFQSTSRQINFFLRKNKPEKLQEIGTQIDSSAQHLNNMLNNLLNWVLTQQQQKIQLEKTTLNLYKSVEEVLKSYQTIALAHDIEIKNTIPKETFIWVDTDTFQTIIRNLISNSLKYTPEKGSISLSIDSLQNENDKIVTLKITDTGIGMSEEIKEKLTSQFIQLDLNHTQRGLRGEKSTGLGLVLCYEFAALNDIKIKLESKQNEGTTFYLLIPTKSKEEL